MAIYNLTTGVGYNNYSSHVVGYESKRHRREMFSFTVPSTLDEKPVLNPKIKSCKINFDANTTGQHFGFGADPTVGGEEIPIYFSVGEGDFNSSIQVGTVTNINGENTTFTVVESVVLTPGKTYTLYVYTDRNSYGWYAFGSGYTKLNLGIEYVSYTECTAPDASSIIISPAIQKPGGKITISWGAGEAGTSNAIIGYNVQYQIGSEGWSSTYGTTSTSKEITLPTTATRGVKITARVMTVGSVSGYDSSYSGDGGSGRINNLPGAPTVSIDKTLIPSDGATVKFSLTAGGVGTDDAGQSASLYYATSSTGTKTACTTNFSPTVKASTTYYFWTYDGLEYSSSYVSKTITVNTKPTVTLSISGTQANNEKATFTKGNNGQSSDNTYTFGFTYNNQDYILSSNQTGPTYYIGDMRKQLSDKLGGLIDDTTYSYNFWVYRNDGMENSDKVTTTVRTLSVPRFILKNDIGVAKSFSKILEVTLSGATTGTYSTIGFTGATTNGLTLETDNLAWGTKIDKLLINNSFYVTPQTTLYKVYEIDIIPSGGKISPFSLSTFKTYTTQQLGISLVGRTTADYGLTTAPNLILKYGTTTLQTISNSSTDVNTYIYYANGSSIYPKINTGASTIDLTFELQNQFGDSFTRTFTLQLDHTEPAIPYTNINLYPGTISSTSMTKYPALNQWNYLKEGMPIYTDFSVLAFDKPTFIFEIYDYPNSKNWNTITSFEGTKMATTLTNYGGVYFNTPPSRYYVTGKQLIETINEITQDHSVQFRMRIQTTEQEAIYNFFNGTSLLMKAHYDGRAYFTKINFADSNLETEWEIEEPGYSSNGTITQLGLGIKEYKADIRKTTYPTSQKYVWENFTGFEYDDKTYEFLHITPILYTTLTTSTKDGEYSGLFKSEKVTENFMYTVVYNISPTVSYRPNALGINYQNVYDLGDAVLALSAYSNRKKIYLIGTGENYATIDILTGALSNFIVDCGSWDDTSGGIVIEKPEYQQLAPIAYTGDIRDLEQNHEEPIILLVGGSAEEI